MLGLRRLPITLAVKELLWMLTGPEDISALQAQGVRWWNKEAKEDGWIGLSYGLMVRFPISPSESVNQLQTVERKLCKAEESRNIVVSSTSRSFENV